MNSPLKRSYRKRLLSHGLIYIDNVEREITVKNISLTGILATLDNITDIDRLLPVLSAPSILDIYLPELELSGEAEIVRIENNNRQISLAIKFKDIFHELNHLPYTRKAYRKKLAVPGEIIIYGLSQHFETVNISIDGLMIHLEERLSISEKTIAEFKIPQLDLEGDIKIIWAANATDGTSLGLQYVNIGQDTKKFVPNFKLQ